MKTSVNLYDFRKAFHDMDKGNNFSYKGLEALFNYLEEYEQDTGEEIELDVIALCCEYTEYDSVDEFFGEEGHNIEEIEYSSSVIPIKGTSRFIVGY